MAVPFRRVFASAALCTAVLGAAAVLARADEIRLKDGKKLYGVIVAYEENMFKVKTDFGYVLVEKDKIATIIPTTAAEATPANGTPANAKNGGADAGKPAANAAASSSPARIEPTTATATNGGPSPTNASAKTAIGKPHGKADEKATGKITNAPVKPELPANSTTEAAAPATKSTPAAASNSPIAPPAQPPAPPKAPEVPAIREDVQGNLYTNYTHGFKMFKAPSWQLIDDARNALPNAIVAMGTSNESTLMVVGREKIKEPLDAAAVTVEKRLREVYENYRQVSQRKATVGGSPAIEFHYVGKADEHDWAGTLVVIARGTDIFTLLGMTYADSDLIQIQENVISKAIASLSFDVHESSPRPVEVPRTN